MKKKGETVILVREETNPEDVEGMRAAEGILTARGGMTSHAALVARGWGKCCIVGAGDMKIDMAGREAYRRRREAQGRRSDHAQRHQGQGLCRGARNDGRHGESEIPSVHEARRQVPHDGRAHQRRHAGRRQGRPRFRRGRHRPVPHRAHVLRHRQRRAAVRPAEDDFEQERRRAARRP